MYAIVNKPERFLAQHSLVTSATQESEQDPHWEGGFTYTPCPCFGDLDFLNFVRNDCPPDEPNAAYTLCTDEVEYTPYTATVAVGRPAGTYSFDEVAELATEVLSERLSPTLTNYLIYGDVADSNPYVADNASVVGTELSPIIALGTIQSALSWYGTKSTLYMSAATATAVSEQLTLDENGRLITIVRGDLVIVESSVSRDETGANLDLGAGYIFGHLGEPVLRFGAVELFEGFDQTENVRYVRATQTVAATFDPCQTAAVGVRLYDVA